LLFSDAWIGSLTNPVFAEMGNEFPWRDLILIRGGLFLLVRAV